MAKWERLRLERRMEMHRVLPGEFRYLVAVAAELVTGSDRLRRLAPRIGQVEWQAWEALREGEF